MQLGWNDGCREKIFDAIENKSIKHVVTPVDDNTMNVQMIFDSVYADAHGDEIAGTEGVYEFTTLLTYTRPQDRGGQTWDTAKMDNMPNSRRKPTTRFSSATRFCSARFSALGAPVLSTLPTPTPRKSPRSSWRRTV